MWRNARKSVESGRGQPGPGPSGCLGSCRKRRPRYPGQGRCRTVVRGGRRRRRAGVSRAREAVPRGAPGCARTRPPSTETDGQQRPIRRTGNDPWMSPDGCRISGTSSPSALPPQPTPAAHPTHQPRQRHRRRTVRRPPPAVSRRRPAPPPCASATACRPCSLPSSASGCCRWLPQPRSEARRGAARRSLGAGILPRTHELRPTPPPAPRADRADPLHPSSGAGVQQRSRQTRSTAQPRRRNVRTGDAEQGIFPTNQGIMDILLVTWNDGSLAAFPPRCKRSDPVVAPSPCPPFRPHQAGLQHFVEELTGRCDGLAE